MTRTLVVDCPRCGGRGYNAAFVDYADGSGEFRSDLPCTYCGGAGKWSAERVEAYRAGETMRRDRVARGLSLWEEANRLGVDPVELSRRERGHE